MRSGMLCGCLFEVRASKRDMRYEICDMRSGGIFDCLLPTAYTRCQAGLCSQTQR